MSIEAAITWLDAASLEQLRDEWRGRYGAAPRLRSVMLLRSVLAWRIQADAFGGLDHQTRMLLHDVRGRGDPIVAPGTIFIREWRGKRHEVEVSADSLLYQGKRWQSLSEIARDITGTRCNGPRFFGLREGCA